MRIGVVSDTHDRLEAVAEAVRLLIEQRVELILHCGDIESVETVRAFQLLPTHFVFGNWDRDKAKLTAAIKAIGGTAHDGFGALELAGKRVAWVHSHERHQLYQLFIFSKTACSGLMSTGTVLSRAMAVRSSGRTSLP